MSGQEGSAHLSAGRRPPNRRIALFGPFDLISVRTYTGKGQASRLIHAAGAEATETLCGQDLNESDVLDVCTLPTCKKCLRAIEDE
jgi:hypothetical protein